MRAPCTLAHDVAASGACGSAAVKAGVGAYFFFQQRQRQELTITLAAAREHGQARLCTSAQDVAAFGACGGAAVKAGDGAQFLASVMAAAKG